jgi:hypothetical protein
VEVVAALAWRRGLLLKKGTRRHLYGHRGSFGFKTRTFSEVTLDVKQQRGVNFTTEVPLEKMQTTRDAEAKRDSPQVLSTRSSLWQNRGIEKRPFRKFQTTLAQGPSHGAARQALRETSKMRQDELDPLVVNKCLKTSSAMWDEMLFHWH